MTSLQTSERPAPLKRCNRHGVLFNEELYNSCAVCRASANSPKLAISSLLSGLAGIGLIGCGVAIAGGPTMMALAEAGDRAMAETAQTMRLDPHPVRIEIESLEKLVYGIGPLADEPGPAIRAAAADLAQSVTELNGATASLIGRFGREIEAFGARSDPRRSGDPSSHELTTSVDWETVRSRIFAEAHWYRHSGSGRGE